MTARLEGLRAIVTGAASGIGRAAADRFADEGADVIRVDRTAGEGITTADVTDESAVEALCAGGVDVMFANAGVVGELAPLLDLEGDDVRRVFEVNVMGAFFCVKHAARQMKAAGRGGSIICTASVAGLRAGAGPAHYSASKAAIISLVKSAAVQLGGTQIRCNAIAPGLIETGMTAPLFAAARAAGKIDRIGQLNPLRRAGAADEIAAVALFLASRESSYVNGEVVVADGGLSSSLPFVPGKMW